MTAGGRKIEQGLRTDSHSQPPHQFVRPRPAGEGKKQRPCQSVSQSPTREQRQRINQAAPERTLASRHRCPLLLLPPYTIIKMVSVTIPLCRPYIRQIDNVRCSTAAWLDRWQQSHRISTTRTKVSALVWIDGPSGGRLDGRHGCIWCRTSLHGVENAPSSTKEGDGCVVLRSTGSRERSLNPPCETSEIAPDL